MIIIIIMYTRTRKEISNCSDFNEEVSKRMLKRTYLISEKEKLGAKLFCGVYWQLKETRDLSPITFPLRFAWPTTTRRLAYTPRTATLRGMRSGRYDYGELHNSGTRNGQPPAMQWSRNGALLPYKSHDLPAIRRESVASFIALLVIKSPMA